MNLHVSRTQLLGLAALTVAAMSANAQSLVSQYGELVHAVGDVVPAAAVGVTPAPGATINSASNFDGPMMDQNGTILYRARMLGGGTSTLDDRAYFLGRANGDLQMVVRAGDPAPGIPGALLRNTSSNGLTSTPRITPFGEILFFQSSLFGPVAAQDTAFFWGPPSGLLPLAQEGTQIPFLSPGDLYGPLTANSHQNTAINNSGQVLFGTTVFGAPAASDAIVVTGTPGLLSLVLREGDVMAAGPNLVGGEVLVPVSGASTMSFVNQINEAGQVLTELKFSTLVGPATVVNDRAVAVWTPGPGLSVIAREDMQAPGLPVGVKMKDSVSFSGWSAGLSQAGFNKLGNVVFNTNLEDGGVTTGVDDKATYYGGSGGLSLVIRRYDQVPSLPLGVLWGAANNSNLALNDLGQVAFTASLQGAVTTADDTVVAIVPPVGSPVIVAREGDVAPATTATVNGPWIIQSITQAPLLNNLGQLLFKVDVSDTVTFKPILYSYDPTVGVQLQLDGADTFTTSLGTSDWYTLGGVGNTSSGDTGHAAFNNSGDFVLRVHFNNPTVATAIVRGHVGTMICEPSSVPVTGGVPQNFHIDAGPSHPFEIYVVLATALGTRPGFTSPFGPQNIPLNYDILWTQLSLDAANSTLWVNNIGITDGSGKGIGAAGFVMPAGYPGFAGTTVHHAAVLLDFSLSQTHVSEPSALKLY